MIAIGAILAHGMAVKDRWFHWSRLLLVFVPAAGILDAWQPAQPVWTFACAALALFPLAGLIGGATETLADRLGGATGGLLNATFGNAAELIIGALALRRGLPDLVKASITGSIIGNVLLVFGAAALAGGLRRPFQRFNRTAAGAGTTMLILSAVALTVPAVFHWLARATDPRIQLELDAEIAVVLLLAYACYLLFTLHTHRRILARVPQAAADGLSERLVGERHEERPEPEHERRPDTGVTGALVTLVMATIAASYVSELLVSTVEATSTRLGVTHLFIGVIVVAVVGNAAEHYSAVTLAMHDRMDAALAIAVGSSTQVALFVAPVLVFLSYVIAPQPLNLLFTTFEVASVVMSVLVIAFIAHDGETHWMEGVMLLSVYVILALGFFFLPAPR